MKGSQVRYFITEQGKVDLKKGWFARSSTAIGSGVLRGDQVLKKLRVRLKSGMEREELESVLRTGWRPYKKEKGDLARVLRSLRAEGLLEGRVVLERSETKPWRSYKRRALRITPPTPRLRR